MPGAHIPHFVYLHILQSCLIQHFRDACASRRFRTRWRGNRGQRGLAAERRFVGAFDVRARGAHVIVGEKCGDGFNHCRELY